MVWGKVILRSNGVSYMDFKLHVDVNKAMDGELIERLVISIGDCLYHSFVVDNIRM